MAKDKLKLNTYNNVHMKPIMTLCQDTRIPVMFWAPPDPLHCVKLGMFILSKVSNFHYLYLGPINSMLLAFEKERPHIMKEFYESLSLYKSKANMPGDNFNGRQLGMCFFNFWYSLKLMILLYFCR